MIPIPIKRQGWTSTSMIVGDLQTRSDRYLQRVEKRGGAYARIHRKTSQSTQLEFSVYLPHPCFLKSFILVVATGFPKNFNPPRALTSPPLLSSMKRVMLLTLWYWTNLSRTGSAPSRRSSAVSSRVVVGSTSSTSSNPRFERLTNRSTPEEGDKGFGKVWEKWMVWKQLTYHLGIAMRKDLRVGWLSGSAPELNSVSFIEWTCRFVR